MIPKKFDAIDLSSIQQLIDDNYRESTTIEYKENLKLGGDRDTKEFLADISSFANTEGGDIIFGIRELRENGSKTGIPELLTPLTEGTPDEIKLRMEGLLQTGLAPRLPVQIKEIGGVGGDEGSYIIVVRVPQSASRPHMVKHGKTTKFYMRHSSGKYPLDVDQIRNAFFATESQADKVRQFIQERLGAIATGETPVKLETSHRLAIHLIPINSFLNRERVTIPQPDHSLRRYIVLSGEEMSYTKYSLDGYITHSPIREPNLDCRGYCSLQFSGLIESVDSSLVRYLDNQRQYDKNGKPHVSLFNIDNIISDSVKAYIEGYKVLGISPPLLLSVALLGFRGVSTVTDEYYFSDRKYALDRNIAVLPSIMIDNITEDVSQHLKPLLDSLWNSFGFEKCLDYNQQGIWEPLHPRRR